MLPFILLATDDLSKMLIKKAYPPTFEEPPYPLQDSMTTAKIEASPLINKQRLAAVVTIKTASKGMQTDDSLEDLRK